MKTKRDYEQGCQLSDLSLVLPDRLKNAVHNLQFLPGELAVVRDEAGPSHHP